MVEVKVKVSITDKKKKKSRKPRKTKKPKFSTGSIDFKTIGTNATRLVGLVASSRAVAPTLSQDNQLINELRKKEEQVTNNELVIKQQNIPPQPQFKPDTEQAQEENATKVRQAMGKRISGLRQEEASLILKGKEMEERNMMINEELQQKQNELIEQDQAIDLKRKNFIVEQIYGTTADSGFARIKSQLTGIEYTGKEIKNEIQEGGGIENYRKYLVERAGLNPILVDKKQVKVGERGKGRTDWFYNPQKVELRRAQEEVPELGDLQDLED